jgi:hypothetical protein
MEQPARNVALQLAAIAAVAATAQREAAREPIVVALREAYDMGQADAAARAADLLAKARGALRLVLAIADAADTLNPDDSIRLAPMTRRQIEAALADDAPARRFR